MWCSIILLTIDSGDIGLWFVGVALSLSLGIGTNYTGCFPAMRKCTRLERKVKQLCEQGGDTVRVDFSILAEIPSGLLLLVTSSLCSRDS